MQTVPPAELISKPVLYCIYNSDTKMPSLRATPVSKVFTMCAWS